MCHKTVLIIGQFFVHFVGQSINRDKVLPAFVKIYLVVFSFLVARPTKPSCYGMIMNQIIVSTIAATEIKVFLGVLESLIGVYRIHATDPQYKR